MPKAGLGVLESYLACTEPEVEANRQTPQHRALTMCQALWGRHPSENAAGGAVAVGEELGLNKTLQVVGGNMTFLNGAGGDTLGEEQDYGEEVQRKEERRTVFAMENLARKQAVSEWIRFVCFL